MVTKFMKTKKHMTEDLAEVLLAKEGYKELSYCPDYNDGSVVSYMAGNSLVAVLYKQKGILAWNPKKR